MILLRVFLLVALTSHKGIQASFEFNNVKCVTMDPKYISFEYCFLRSVNRTYKYLSIKAIAHHLPIDNGWISMKVLQRGNKNILERYAVNVDACRFLKDRVNPMANFLFSLFEEYSNINHTCPFNQNFILEKLPVHHINSFVEYMLPDGQYALNSTWLVDNIKRVDIIVYFSKR